MGCEGSKGCHMGECPGCCKSREGNEYSIGLNSIVELEIHYRGAEDAEAGYTLEKVYYITNTQRKELVSTGLEGKGYDDLEAIKVQVTECLDRAGNFTSGLHSTVDISYINEDIMAYYS